MNESGNKETHCALSVVVITKNEEERIARCLDSVKWADEIIVVDDESSDKTVAISRQYTDKVCIKKMDIEGEGKHRNWAYQQASHSWVLSLDADEVVSEPLKNEIIETLKICPAVNGFSIPRKNYIGDYFVRFGGWYPAGQLKLFKKDEFLHEEAEIHGRAFMAGPCGHLKGDIIHHTYRDIEHFLTKLNRQTTLEARKWYRQGKPMRLGRFLWRATDRFFRAYVKKRGYKDGFIGFVVAFHAALYQIISYLKYREIVWKNSRRLHQEKI